MLGTKEKGQGSPYHDCVSLCCFILFCFSFSYVDVLFFFLLILDVFDIGNLDMAGKKGKGMKIELALGDSVGLYHSGRDSRSRVLTPRYSACCRGQAKFCFLDVIVTVTTISFFEASNEDVFVMYENGKIGSFMIDISPSSNCFFLLSLFGLLLYFYGNDSVFAASFENVLLFLFVSDVPKASSFRSEVDSENAETQKMRACCIFNDIAGITTKSVSRQ